MCFLKNWVESVNDYIISLNYPGFPIVKNVATPIFREFFFSFIGTYVVALHRGFAFDPYRARFTRCFSIP